MESDTVSVLRKVKTVKARLESLDKSNVTNRRLSERYQEGSCVDRTRVLVTNGLRVKLREMMNDFQSLREKVLSDHNASGEFPSEDMVEKVVSGGEKVVEMDMRSKERHGAVNVMDIQRSLQRLHHVFLDMAVLVEAQEGKNQ
ncbi:hypothetical protein PTKIN_Ptkin07bG0292700 [Pterospermum kingtungense]